MYQHIEVEWNLNGLDRELSKQVWHFLLIDNELILDSYSAQERPTKRHKWEIKLHYNRLDSRRSFTKLADVEIPDFIAKEAKQKLIDSITVVKEMTR